MDRLLRAVMSILGAAIVLIGLAHVVAGTSIIAGAGPFSSSIDSEDRFFGAIFVFYGVAWILCVRRYDARLLQLLAGAFFLGGVARLISMWQTGMPHALYIVLTVVELLLPVAIIAMARSSNLDKKSGVQGE